MGRGYCGGGAGARGPRAGLAPAYSRSRPHISAFGTHHARRRARRRHRAGGLVLGAPHQTAERLARHAGQISFPGGRADPGDGTPRKTALREAEEEIGLPQASVQIVGRLDDYLVGTGYRITPVVGFVAAPPVFEADSQEVAEVFEVPLTFVLEPSNYRRDKVTIGGVERRFYVLPYGAYYIWGATAAILVNFRDVVRASC